MASSPEEILGNAFVFLWWMYPSCILPWSKALFPRSSWCSPDKPELSKHSQTQCAHPIFQSFLCLLCLPLFILLLVNLCVWFCCPHRTPTACWAGRAVPRKACRDEKHSLIFLCTVTCTTFDHTQRLSHSWLGPKGRNDSRKTTLLAASAASRTLQSLLPHLQFVADLAKRGIQLQALWFK